jgi:hypothetical protein
MEKELSPEEYYRMCAETFLANEIQKLINSPKNDYQIKMMLSALEIVKEKLEERLQR